MTLTVVVLAVLRPEPLGTVRLRQRPDGRKSVVLKQYENDLRTLLDDRCQLHRQHLVGAITDNRNDLGIRQRHLHAQ